MWANPGIKDYLSYGATRYLGQRDPGQQGVTGPLTRETEACSAQQVSRSSAGYVFWKIAEWGIQLEREVEVAESSC